ncbi:hypothetical protein A4H97_22285 [Niastella yeongjuensis]|uniref:Short-chain dehydrogenase n=1 Tax=Niastella yeongjuensis TaxID=354355 RepID=A0A1V9F750_9BACT|nr:SDR family NAD(P)-dependent oxidoreductase [Niastella yeongjuensis]OQP54229.1 hypothetical protein A4H97_22285 [Niastella yeongjuensis]SEP31628.1 NADP-dependent 3-hydroxy acid dehydrogenase YdfG [Niastella yeongjuensis]
MKERIAIITGAGSGIGKATVYRLAEQRIRMVLNARTLENLVAVQKEADRIAGIPCTQIVCGDAADGHISAACIAQCFTTWNQPPDIFIASAGRGLPGTVITSNPEEWNSLIDINIKGLMHQLRHIGNSMVQQVATGRDCVLDPLDIVVIGSTVGRNISPFNSVYGATKFAAHGLTEALRRQLGPQGIRVTLIEPGLVHTNFQESAGYSRQWFDDYSKEVGPILQPGDIAAVIGFLLSLPGNVNLDNISIRPTRQAYP